MWLHVRSRVDLGNHLFPAGHALFYLRRKSTTGCCAMCHLRDVYAGRDSGYPACRCTPLPQVFLSG